MNNRTPKGKSDEYIKILAIILLLFCSSCSVTPPLTEEEKARQIIYCRQTIKELNLIRSIKRSAYRSGMHGSLREREKLAKKEFLIYCE